VDVLPRPKPFRQPRKLKDAAEVASQPKAQPKFRLEPHPARHVRQQVSVQLVKPLKYRPQKPAAAVHNPIRKPLPKLKTAASSPQFNRALARIEL